MRTRAGAARLVLPVAILAGFAGALAGAGALATAAPSATAPADPAPAASAPPAEAKPSLPPEAPAPAVAPAPDPARRESEGGHEVVGKIKGTVFDGAKKTMAGLLVRLSGRDDSGLLRVTGTDEKGQYLFRDLPAGTYDLEVEAAGYAPQTKGTIVVRPPFQNIVDFVLGPARGGSTAAARIGAPRTGAPPSETRAVAPATGTPVTGAAPGTPVRVRGTFLNQERRPVPEVSVTFVALAGAGSYQAFSADDGSFAIDGVPSGLYRVLVSSPGHVALDLKSVAVSPATGLNLSLSLVDYPLNFKGRQEALLPREEPLPPPAAAP